VTRESEIALAIAALGAVLDAEKVSYLAVPITSGRRLWDLAIAMGIKNPESAAKLDRPEYEKRVLEPNLLEAAKLSKEVREWFRGVLIEPFKFFSEEWSQEDYRSLWKKVLDRWVGRVILSPRWVYSRGCVEECLTAYLKGALVQSNDGQALSPDAIMDTIVAAMREGELFGLEVSFLADAFARLSERRCIKR